MTLQIRGYAAQSASTPLTAHRFERRAPRADDLVIDILYCGVCHSDLHTARNDWGWTTYPIVPGHEIIGRVRAVGTAVTRFKAGDAVGVGCLVDACRHCQPCEHGEEQYCQNGFTGTYGGTDRHDGRPTQGGYSDQIVVSDRFVLKVPESLDLRGAAPLLCAGITTWSPLRHWKVGPGSQVAIVGLGGLGHMGLKLAVAMGAEVTVMSRSLTKRDDSLAMGATDHISTVDDDALRAHRSSFDFILNTVSADLDLETYLKLLKPRGVLVNVGLPTERYAIRPGMLVGNSKVVAGSNIGGIPETKEMLAFCAEHGIGATIETISADEVTEAYDKVVNGDVRYRYVIDVSTISAD